MQHVAAAKARGAVHYGMSVKNAIIAQFDLIANHCIGPDAHSGA
jgi:hypothetical protein